MRRTTQFLVLSLVVFLVCLPAFSQLNLGRLSGTVTDETGGVMAGAKVTVTDQDRGVARALTADEAGAYSAPSLTPGNYTVRVEAAGFNVSERKDVVVQVGGDARVDIVMKAGSTTQTITVNESVPLINTTSATLGGVIEGNEVSTLPFVGRSYQSLLQFQPGVVTRPGGGSNGHSSNGMRSDGNNWLFEGIFSGGVRTAGSIINTNSSTGDGASVIPPDAIQEMGVSFQNKSEYGWKPGVASNVGIKSGTNVIHGTAFAVGQTSKLNARNPFLPAGAPVPDLSYQQYGATVGGPIKKDKLFFFGAFEGMQFTQGVPTTHKVPTSALVAGDAANSIPAAYLDMRNKALAAIAAGWTGCPLTCPINAAAIDASGKVVNAALLNSPQQLSSRLVDTGIFQNGVPGSDGSFPYGFTATRDPNKNLLGKVNYNLNDKHQISGLYFWARDTEVGDTQTVLQPYWAQDFYLTSQSGRANWTYLPSSTWVNEFHWGIDRKVENNGPVECNPGRSVPPPNYAFVNTGAATPCLGFNDVTLYALPTIAISGFDTLGAGGAQRRVEGYWTIVNNVSYTAGNHNMKFGFETRRSWFSGASYAASHGTTSFGTASINAFTGATPLQSFLMGVPSTGSILTGDPTALIRNWAFGTFVQDDWRVTQRVTLNIGLRWEYQTPIQSDFDKLATFDPLTLSGYRQIGQNLDSVWKPAVFGPNLQPRFGVAWDVSGKGTTVLRAGYGIYSNWPVWSVFISNANLIGNPTGAVFVAANGATSFQGDGTMGSATLAFPSTSATQPGINWTLAGPIFPTGQIKCGDNLTPAGKPKNPGTCTSGYIDPHWTVPYVQQWNVGIQHAIASNISVDVAYVGNHGTNLIGAYDNNMPTVGTSNATRIQQSRPYYPTPGAGQTPGKFPWIAKLNYLTNKDFSNYNALQASMNQRSWHGLTTNLSYTYGHTLDVTQTDITQNVNPNPLCPLCDYGPTGFDVRHRMTIRATYAVPGKKSFGQILEGWQLSTLVNLIGALPYNGADSSTNLSGTAEGNERWSLIGNADDFNGYGHFVGIPCWGVTGNGSNFDSNACTRVANVNLLPTACINAANTLPTNPNVPSSDTRSTGLKSLGTLGCYVAGNSVIVPPAQGTFGNMGRNIFRGAGLRLWDFSVRKMTHVTERIGAEFQFDMYNVTNSPQFAAPGTSLVSPGAFGQSSATPNVSNGNVVQGTGDARRYQFGLHLSF